MKRLLSGAALLLTCFAGNAIPPTPPRMHELADYVMRSHPTSAELAFAAESLAPIVASESDPGARLLYRAMIEFLVGFGERGNGRLAEADARFQAAVALAREANTIEESSEGYRVLADAHNQLLDIRPASYKIFNAGAARRAAQRAVELDPENALANISAAGFFVSAPPIAGGDPDRGRDHLARAAGAADSDYVRFLVAVWQGRLAVAERREQDARTAFSRAQSIYPGNWWLNEVARDAGIALP